MGKNDTYRPINVLSNGKCNLRISITGINSETFGGVVIGGLIRFVNFARVFDNVKSSSGE